MNYFIRSSVSATREIFAPGPEGEVCVSIDTTISVAPKAFRIDSLGGCEGIRV